MKEIFLICLLLAGMLPSSTPNEPVVLLTNSIDKELNSEFINFLEAERSVNLVDASEFENYKNSTYIAILGGDKAPEGVGDIVDMVLSAQEKNDIAQKERMLIKLNLWKEGQVVVFLAGPDRERTREACQESSKCYTSLLKAIETVRQGVTAPEQKIVFLWPQLLSSSDIISPYSPKQSEITEFPHIVPYPLKESSWFFWIDDTPYAKYAHPVRFFFFGVESQDSTVYSEEWWPVLNGKSLWVEEDEYWNTSYWVYNPGLSKPKSSIFYRTGAALTQEEEPVGNALVVNGWKAGESCKEGMAEDEKGMTGVLNEMGFATERARTVKEMETKLKNWARQMKPCNTMIIYITAHGGKGYVVIGGEKFTVSQCADLLSTFEEGVHIFFMVDACYGGSFIADEMKKEAEVIITATSADKCAYGDFDPQNDPNPSDKGSEFTSGLVESLTCNFPESGEQPLSPPDTYGRIFGKVEEVMLDAVLDDASAQNGLSDPQIWMIEFVEGPPLERIKD